MLKRVVIIIPIPEVMTLMNGVMVSLRERLRSHMKRESEIQTKHDELKKDVGELQEQLELIKRDSTSLENAFDKLHQRYVKQKAVHQCLVDRNKAIQQYMTELKAWNQQDTEAKQEMQIELHALEQRLA